jgi:hypothetical protein
LPARVSITLLGQHQDKEWEHEGTFVDYYCHLFDPRRRRIRAITERAAKKQLASGGAKSEQFEFVSAVGVPFDTVVAEFYAVDP